MLLLSLITSEYLCALENVIDSNGSTSNVIIGTNDTLIVQGLLDITGVGLKKSLAISGNLGSSSYIRTHEGWLYLATVIDLYSRKVIGWATGHRQSTSLKMLLNPRC